MVKITKVVPQRVLTDDKYEASSKSPRKPEKKEGARVCYNADLLLKRCGGGRWAIGLIAAWLCLSMYLLVVL